MEAVETYCRSLNGLGEDGEVIQALFDEEPDDAVRVEEEVASASVLVANDSEQGLELRGLREREDGRRERGRCRLRGRCVVQNHGRCAIGEKCGCEGSKSAR